LSGRGTLNEFAVGALVQHFPKTLQRRPGIDFRLPTQGEVDALEAFQLFTGKQTAVDVTPIQFREPRANNGSALFLTGAGLCTGCHVDLLGSLDNPSFNTGVVALKPNLPFDDGFLHDGIFNIPPLIEAADTGPFFHNNARQTIEDAVNFYVSEEFRTSPDGSGFDIQLTDAEQGDIAIFLRVLNAAENLREVRKRLLFVRDQRGAGNTSILTIALADTQDAINDLAQKNLNPVAQSNLADLKQTLIIARANADADRPPFITHALDVLARARADLFTANPNNSF